MRQFLALGGWIDRVNGAETGKAGCCNALIRFELSETTSGEFSGIHFSQPPPHSDEGLNNKFHEKEFVTVKLLRFP